VLHARLDHILDGREILLETRWCVSLGQPLPSLHVLGSVHLPAVVGLDARAAEELIEGERHFFIKSGLFSHDELLVLPDLQAVAVVHSRTGSAGP